MLTGLVPLMFVSHVYFGQRQTDIGWQVLIADNMVLDFI